MFCGDRQVGKSSLISAYIDEGGAGSAPKETLALDFKTGEKSSGMGDDKINVNCYEVGGGRELSSLLQAPLSVHNIENIASICICVDSSDPL